MQEPLRKRMNLSTNHPILQSIPSRGRGGRRGVRARGLARLRGRGHRCERRRGVVPAGSSEDIEDGKDGTVWVNVCPNECNGRRASHP